MTRKTQPPQRPAEPDPADCCGEGCVNCVHDVHDAAMERYRRELAAWEARGAEADDGGAGGS